MNFYNFKWFILIAIPCFWAGGIASISFLEAPLKFQAPGISLEEGLSIGRLVFPALNKTEWLLLTLWGMAVGFVQQRKLRQLLAFTVILLSLQTFWLLPHLDLRAETIQKGFPVTNSPLHLYFILTQILKIAGLLASSFFAVSFYINLLTLKKSHHDKSGNDRNAFGKWYSNFSIKK